jgi:hypothetical protein
VLCVRQIAYFTDPVSIIGVVALIVTLLVTHNSGHKVPKLTSSDKRAALWCVVSGALIIPVLAALFALLSVSTGI